MRPPYVYLQHPSSLPPILNPLFQFKFKAMLPRAAPPDGDRGLSLSRGRGRGRGRGGSEYGGGTSERSGGPSGSLYGHVRYRGIRGAGRGHRGGSDSGGPRGRSNRGRGSGVAVEASAAAVEPGVDVVEAGGYPPLALPTLSMGRTGPLPAEHVEATGLKRRKFGNAGRVVKLRSNHVEVKLDQGYLYHYDGMYLSHSRGRQVT
jgi:hypothetical protein